MRCGECARLMAEHERLDTLQTNAVHALYHGPLMGHEFVKQKIALDDARMDAEIARLELTNHHAGTPKRTNRSWAGRSGLWAGF
jgi:hypothetical protein